MGRSEIHLDGTETSVIKAIGITGGDIKGDELMALLPDLVEMELVDILKGLITMGYVVADRQAFYDKAGLEITTFHVNSGYSKDLKEAMDPSRNRPKSKRIRRE
jgi:hypothetical protein